MAVKVGINGFGRIGRNIYRTAIGDPDIDFVAVNDLTDTRTLAHLLKYDSVLGNLDHNVTATENGIKVENDEFRVFSQRDPAAIDWESVGAEIVVESTGIFTKAEDAKKHLHGSVKKVIISAPTDSQSIAAGSRCEKTRNSSFPTLIPFSVAVTSWSRLPSTESYFSKCARVRVSVRSLTATKSMSGSPIAVR